MKIALGTDHAGYRLKEAIKAHLIRLGYDVVGFGTENEESVDYPDYDIPAAECVSAQNADLAIVFGGSGNGEAIAANKVKGVRCALCWSERSARLAKQHNNANVIALGGRVVSQEVGLKIVDAWLTSNFEGGRHQRRIDKLTTYESNGGT